MRKIVVVLFCFIMFDFLLSLMFFWFEPGYIEANNNLFKYSVFGWELNQNVYLKERMIDQSIIEIRTNVNGFRGPNILTTNIDVIFIGDSMTFGHGSNTSYPETYSILANKTVLNAAVPGYGTDQSVLTLERYLRQIKTKKVVYGLCYNDYNDNIRDAVETTVYIHKPVYYLKENAYVLANFKKNNIAFYLNKSPISLTIKTVLKKSFFIRNSIFFIKRMKQKKIWKNTVLTDEQIQTMKANLFRFKIVCEYFKAEPIIFILPHYVYSENIEESTEKIANQLGIRFIKKQAKMEDKYYVKNDWHFNDAGNVVIGSFLKNSLQ